MEEVWESKSDLSCLNIAIQLLSTFWMEGGRSLAFEEAAEVTMQVTTAAVVAVVLTCLLDPRFTCCSAGLNCACLFYV